MNLLANLFTNNSDQFTGAEQERIVALLSFLALTSFVMWTIVTLSIVARIFAKLFVRRSRRKLVKNGPSPF